MLVAAVVVLWALTGLWLLVTGLQPRAVDDHPVCAACRYDLVGMKHALPGNCPECGAVLRPGAGEVRGVNTGNRRRRARRACVGAAVFGLWLLVVVPVGVSVVGGAQLAKFAPTWLLILQAEHVSGRAANAAVDELMSRGKVAGAVPAGVQLRLAKHALAVQRSTSPSGRATAAWNRSWAGVLEDPALLGLLSKAEQDEAMAAGVHGWMVARKIVTQGHALPFGVRINVDPRMLNPTGRELEIKTMSIRILDASGQQVAASEQSAGLLVQPYIDEDDRGWAGSENRVTLDIPPGVYSLEAACELRIVHAGVVSATVPVQHRQQFEVLAPGAGPGGVIEAPELLDQLRNQLHLSLVRTPDINHSTWLHHSWGGPPTHLLGNELAERGLTCVFKVTITAESGGPELNAGTIVFGYRNGTWNTALGGNVVKDPVPGGRYHLRLTPDWEYAEGTVECEKILGGQIELQDVTLPDK